MHILKVKSIFQCGSDIPAYTGPAVFEVFIGNAKKTTIANARNANFANFRFEAEDTKSTYGITNAIPDYYVVGSNTIFMNFFVTKDEDQTLMLFIRSSVNFVTIGYKAGFVSIEKIDVY